MPSNLDLLNIDFEQVESNLKTAETIRHDVLSLAEQLFFARYEWDTRVLHGFMLFHSTTLLNVTVNILFVVPDKLSYKTKQE